MATIDYAMIGVAGLAAASTVLDISNTTSERQPQAQWRPDESYTSKNSTSSINFDELEYDSPHPDNLNGIVSPLISRNTAYTHWSILKINGIEVPGISKITVTFSKDLTKTKLAGYDWANILDNGANPKNISINIKMNAIDYATYIANVQNTLSVKSYSANTGLSPNYQWKKQGKTNVAVENKTPATAAVSPTADLFASTSDKLENVVELENALLADYGIDKAILESMSQSTPELGITEIQLEFVEYIKAVKRPARPSPAAKGSVKQSDSDILPDGQNGYGK